jgi:NAD(P)-dependent dehydrogenase (short-subunit alcohol dehydrogenase family)
VVRRAVEGLGGLDIVVSNAARQQARHSTLDVSTEDFDATMKINIYAPLAAEAANLFICASRRSPPKL